MKWILQKLQDFKCDQMRVSGCKNHYQSVLGAGVKAKSVTSNLPILSVLCLGLYFDLVIHILCKSLIKLQSIWRNFDIDIVIFDRTPESFNKDIINNKHERITRTIWVSCLSYFLLLLLLSRQICNGSCIRTRASGRNINPVYLDSFLAPRQLVPRHCASARHQICNRG